MSTQWFVKIDGKVTGPYTSKQMKQLAQEGLTPSADVCKGDNGKPSKQWVSASKVRGLFDAPKLESTATLSQKSQGVGEAAPNASESASKLGWLISLLQQTRELRAASEEPGP